MFDIIAHFAPISQLLAPWMEAYVSAVKAGNKQPRWFRWSQREPPPDADVWIWHEGERLPYRRQSVFRVTGHDADTLWWADAES